MRVIVNADDFGYSKEISDAIIECFEKKYITDASVMANMPFLEYAVGLLKDDEKLNKFGIHFNLTEGMPVSLRMKNNTKFVSDGSFNGRANSNRVFKFLTLKDYIDLYDELCEQVRIVESLGIRPTHADSHHHVHTILSFLPIFIIVCKKKGIYKIRIHRNAQQFNIIKRALVGVINGIIKCSGLKHTDYFVLPNDLQQLNDTLGIVEIMIHPDYDERGNLIDRRLRERVGFKTVAKGIDLLDIEYESIVFDTFSYEKL